MPTRTNPATSRPAAPGSFGRTQWSWPRMQSVPVTQPLTPDEIGTITYGQPSRPPAPPTDVLTGIQNAYHGAADWVGSQFPPYKFAKARQALFGNRQLPQFSLPQGNIPNSMEALAAASGGASSGGPTASPTGPLDNGQLPQFSLPQGIQQMFPTGPLGNGVPQQPSGGFEPNRSVPPASPTQQPGGEAGDMASEIALGTAPGTPAMAQYGYSQPSTYQPSPPTEAAPAGTPGFEPNRSVAARPQTGSAMLRETQAMMAAVAQASPLQAVAGAEQTGAPNANASPNPYAARIDAMRAHAAKSADLRRYIDSGGTPPAEASGPTSPGTTVMAPTFSAPPEGPAEPFATMNYGERLDARGTTRTQQTAEMLARPQAMMTAQPERLAGVHGFTPGTPGLDDRRDLTFAEWTQAQAAGLPVGAWQGPSGRARAKSTTEKLVEVAGGSGKAAKKAQRSLDRIARRTAARQNTGPPMNERRLMQTARAQGRPMSPADANIQATINRKEDLSPAQVDYLRRKQFSNLSPEAQGQAAAAQIQTAGILEAQRLGQTPEGLNAARAAGGFPTVPAPAEPAPGSVASRIPADHRPMVNSLVADGQFDELKRYLKNTLGWSDDDLDRDFATLSGVDGATAAHPTGPPGWFRSTFLAPKK